MTASRIEPVVHGGDIGAARRRFPDAPEPWIDLSTGINPHAYPVPPVDPAIWERLPQSGAERALREAAAQRYGAACAEQVVAAPGSQALIQIVPRIIATTDVAILGPTYGEHAVSWARCGHRVVERRSLTEIGAARAVVVVNPNNPTGRTFDGQQLHELAAELARRDGLLVVDEAFADFEEAGVSLVPQLQGAAVVLRSFGKAYGLAGARLGFAIASDAGLYGRLRAELGPWAVSAPAIAVGTAALRDVTWLTAASERLASDCGRLDRLLQGAGFEIVGGTRLFRLARHERARAIADKLGRAGILVRSFSAEPEWLRFGLPGSDGQWQRLASALA